MERKLGEFDPATVGPFLDELRGILKDRAEAILVYGSCLSGVTRSATSTPDFFVLVRGYLDFHRSRFRALVNWVLPPSIYHFGTGSRRAKYNVLSFRDLKRDTSGGARDVYQIGRFSKRMALAWSRDSATAKRVAGFQADAMRTVGAYAYHSVPDRFSLEQFAQAALRLSYQGDVRVEAGDKIDRLYRADEEFYREAFSRVLEEFAPPPRMLKTNVTSGSYEKTAHPVSDRIGKIRLSFFLSRSRLRAQLRWPKGILTVEDWLDYLLAKIERTQGIRIEMSPREKRFWYLFGWKHFFALRRRKLIK